VPATPSGRHFVVEQQSRRRHHDWQLVHSPSTQRRLKDHAARVCRDLELQPEAHNDFLQVTPSIFIVLPTLIFS
jgi:hypothetical protein